MTGRKNVKHKNEWISGFNQLIPSYRIGKRLERDVCVVESAWASVALQRSHRTSVSLRSSSKLQCGCVCLCHNQSSPHPNYKDGEGWPPVCPKTKVPVFFFLHNGSRCTTALDQPCGDVLAIYSGRDHLSLDRCWLTIREFSFARCCVLTMMGSIDIHHAAVLEGVA